MKEVKLRNGSIELAPAIAATMLNLKGLLDETPIFFYDFVMLCRNPDYELFGQACRNNLQGRGLIQHNTGQPHSTVKNVILSAVEGEGMEMTLGSPVATE